MASAKTKRRRRRRTPVLLITVMAFALLVAMLVGISVCKQLGVFGRKVVVLVEQQDLIRKYADEYDLEPAYIASVIMAESSYRTDAVSKDNAQGLMQILASNGDWFAGHCGETYTEGSLFDPDTNIRYGSWYLRFLMDRYGGDMILASTAYHQGQGRVDGWVNEYGWVPNTVRLEDIPSDATRSYVGKILKYYERYEEIYA